MLWALHMLIDQKMFKWCEKPVIFIIAGYRKCYNKNYTAVNFKT